MGELLPDGYTWRRPTVKDAEAIFALVAAYNTPIVGFADFTVDDASDYLREPGYDPTLDGWVVEDPGGAVLGLGWACRKGESGLVDIEVIALDDETAGWIFSKVLARAGEVAAEMGHDEVQVDIAIYRADEPQRARATALGFVPATTFHRMRIDHHGMPPEPVLAEGVVVRRGPGDEAFRRQAHALLNWAFADHFGFVPRSFEEWHERIEASTTHDWTQLRVAFVDAEPAAVLHGNDGFVEDLGCGYVSDLGVVPTARGRGLARLLLREAFAEDARRGRKATLLHVDTNNPTPALDLYLSVGMRAVLVTEVWRRAVARSPRH